MGVALSQNADPLAAGFLEPPQEARPLVFWQWINGNVTHEGIRLDLEWMRRVGIGGALMFDIGFRRPPVPQYVERRVGYGTPEWERAVRFAASEAKRLGLKLGAQSSGGWSVSGGSAVPPEHAMKKLVWSETILAPTSADPIHLPMPPTVSGPYQDIALQEHFREPERYADVAVVAYRLPEAEQIAAPRPIVSGASEVALLDDYRYGAATELKPDTSGNAFVHARFESGAVPQAVTIAVRGAMPKGAVEASADGLNWTQLVELPVHSVQPAPVVTLALGERSERFWRIRFTGLAQPVSLTEARFDFGAHVNRFQEKAAYGVLLDHESVATEPVPERAAIEPCEVLDLTARMAADGRLSWRPRAGRWAVLRFGWSLTGRRVIPATDESIGLEVDKLDRAAVRTFAEGFYDRYLRAIGEAGRLDIALTDSWEAGQQNWTADMPQQFAARRGYELLPWMPVLAGRIVGDANRSERFLADYRRTMADMLADHHYGVLAQVARERGMRYFSEAAGTDLPTVIDGMQAKGRVDVPMGEYWFYPEDGAPKSNHVADIREAASAAHVYGRRIVAAEALTTMGEDPWATGPPQLRRIVDRFFTEGVNRVVLHTSAHQPFDDRRPGITLRQYGQHFTRNETWAEDAGDWVRYLARISYLLQQGKPVADLAIFLGEGAAVSPPFGEAGEPRRIEGFDYDFINAEALLTRMSVRGGRLATPDGLSYSVLVLPEKPQRMSLQVIEKIRSLVADGGVLVGPKPIGAHGLAASDARVLAVADQLWGRKHARSARRYGRGRIYATSHLADALRSEGVQPDVALPGPHKLHWAHRATPEAEIYFLSNQDSQPFTQLVRFRVAGRHAEVWNAIDGTRAPASYVLSDEATAVHVALEPWNSCFIVFRGSPITTPLQPQRELRTELITLDGPWQVAFIDGQGAPAQTSFPQLRSWTTQQDPTVRYYSGRARYSRDLVVPGAWLAKDRVELDLGAVGEMARVRINDRDLGVLWSAPYRRDITDALHAGANRIEIIVTNYWINRMIGDRQPGATQVTFAPIQPYSADSPLRASGLLGPVRLVSITPER